MADDTEQLKQKIVQLEFENSKLKRETALLEFEEKKFKQKIERLELENIELYDKWFETFNIKNIAQIKNIDQKIANLERRQSLKSVLNNMFQSFHKDYNYKIEQNITAKCAMQEVLREILSYDVKRENFVLEETENEDHYNLTKSAFFQCLIEILTEDLYFDIATARKIVYEAVMM